MFKKIVLLYVLTIISTMVGIAQDFVLNPIADNDLLSCSTDLHEYEIVNSSAVPIAGLQVELSSSVEISILSASGADATWENGVLTFENEIGSNETVLFQVELSADCVAAIPVFVNC
ncbi:MAG: hypothetical protein ACPGWM_08750, partial [Flavobacteriales bacterium]